MLAILHRSARRRTALVAAGAAAAVAATAAVAPPADAFFAVKRCEGSAINGTGATFAEQAHVALIQAFRSTAAGCPGHAPVSYFATGSGQGRAAMGAGGTLPAGVPGAGTYTAGQRVNEYRFGGSDTGLTSGQIASMNAGDPATQDDDATVRQIPFAAGAVTSTVNYPNDGAAMCPVPPAYAITREGETRLAVPNARLEKAWAGDYATWGEFLGDPDGAGPLQGLGDLSAACAAKPLVRIVRADNSGTTTAWKDFLFEARNFTGASGTNWKGATIYGGAANPNRSWPNTRPGNVAGDESAVDDPNGFGFQTNQHPTTGSPGSDECSAAYVAGTAPFTGAGNPVCRVGPDTGTNQRAGNGPQARLLKRTDGSIAYTELAAAVTEGVRVEGGAAGRKDLFMMPLAVQGAGLASASPASYVEPTNAADGFIEGNDTDGASCQNTPVNNIPGGDSTAQPWSAVNMVMPPSGYSACSLTLLVVWDDYASPYLAVGGNTYDAEERKARALYDYVAYALSDAGQNVLAANDYSRVPSTAMLWAKDGLSRMDWDKKGVGDPNRGKEPVNPGPNTNTGGNTDTGGGPAGDGGPQGGGGPAAPPIAPLPPGVGGTPPSNAFTVPSARTRANQILVALRLPGPGSLQVRAVGTYTERVRRGRRTRTVTRTVTVGTATVNVTRAGEVQVRLNVSRAARRVLAKGTSLRVALTSQFTPTGGSAGQQSRTLTLKGTKPKPRRKAARRG
jgi:ABC-type phosphate transport system substrate-binding protein